MNTQIRWSTVLTLAFLLLFTAHPLHAQEGDGAASQSSALLLKRRKPSITPILPAAPMRPAAALDARN